jgi:hypothetical protein
MARWRQAHPRGVVLREESIQTNVVLCRDPSLLAPACFSQGRLSTSPSTTRVQLFRTPDSAWRTHRVMSCLLPAVRGCGAVQWLTTPGHAIPHCTGLTCCYANANAPPLQLPSSTAYRLHCHQNTGGKYLCPYHIAPSRLETENTAA